MTTQNKKEEVVGGLELINRLEKLGEFNNSFALKNPGNWWFKVLDQTLHSMWIGTKKMVTMARAGKYVDFYAMEHEIYLLECELAQVIQFDQWLLCATSIKEYSLSEDELSKISINEHVPNLFEAC